MCLLPPAEEERSRVSSPSSRPERGRDDDAAREAALEAEFDRERHRQRAMQEDQRRREEREYQRRLDIWERHERLVVVLVQCSMLLCQPALQQQTQQAFVHAAVAGTGLCVLLIQHHEQPAPSQLFAIELALCFCRGAFCARTPGSQPRGHKPPANV